MSQGNVHTLSGSQLREKLSHQLEKIVRKTQANLDKGVFKNPHSPKVDLVTNLNYGGSQQTPSHRGNSARRAEIPTS